MSGKPIVALPRTRTASRAAALQALFQCEQSGEGAETVIAEFIAHRLGKRDGGRGFDDGGAPMADKKLFSLVVRTALEKQEALDGLIAQTLPEDWPLARIDPVLRALLRAGGAELALADGPPVRVVINEYLDIAHGFFQGDEPGMANAVLDRMAKTLRPEAAEGN
jgi:N utilization substance protein B